MSIDVDKAGEPSTELIVTFLGERSLIKFVLEALHLSGFLKRTYGGVIFRPLGVSMVSEGVCQMFKSFVFKQIVSEADWEAEVRFCTS